MRGPRICAYATLCIYMCLLLASAQDEIEIEEEEEQDIPQFTPPRQMPRAFVHPLTDMPDSAPDVATSFYFPEHPDLKFPIGDTITVLCHFRNNGDRPFNATAIMGSVNLPFEFSQHVFNFTYEPIGAIVSPTEEITFEYKFWLHPNLSPTEYAIAHTVFYDDGMSGFSSTFFNQTVELYPAGEGHDILGTIRLLFLLAVTAIVGAVFYFFVIKEEVPTLRKKQAVTQEDEDWVAVSKGKKGN